MQKLWSFMFFFQKYKYFKESLHYQSTLYAKYNYITCVYQNFVIFFKKILVIDKITFVNTSKKK